jgi:hypothetical protein
MMLNQPINVFPGNIGAPGAPYNVVMNPGASYGFSQLPSAGSTLLPPMPLNMGGGGFTGEFMPFNNIGTIPSNLVLQSPYIIPMQPPVGNQEVAKKPASVLRDSRRDDVRFLTFSSHLSICPFVEKLVIFSLFDAYLLNICCFGREHGITEWG